MRKKIFGSRKKSATLKISVRVATSFWTKWNQLLKTEAKLGFQMLNQLMISGPYRSLQLWPYVDFVLIFTGPYIYGLT